MKKTLLVGLFLILTLAVIGFAQYTGSDLERKKPENLYPEPGPGEIQIINQLKETNLQLQEQTKLLTDQNKILLDTLDQIKKQTASQVNGKPQK